jgi:hypothetical protein
MSAATTTSGKSKTAGKVSPSRSTPHVTPANQHANGTVMTKPNASANLVKSGTSPTATVQPKLTVGKPNDSFEQQADAMAQKVVSMTPADVQQLSASKQTIRRQISPTSDANPSRSPLQKKDQPGSFMLQKAVEKEKVNKKEDEKIKKKADEKLQKAEELKKKADEKLQKTEELKKKPDEKLQKTEELKKKGDEKLQKTEELKKKPDEKLQKTEELKKKGDEKLQKAEELKKKTEPVQSKAEVDNEKKKSDKLQLKAEVDNEKKKAGPEEKIQKKVSAAVDEKVQKAAKPTIAEKLMAKLFPKALQLKEEEKLQKSEELKMKADEKLQKKAEPEKIQKAPEQKVQAKETIQPKTAIVQTKPVQLKEEEKLRKTEELKKKNSEEKVQKKAEPEKIQKAEQKVHASKETVQSKPAAVQTKPVQLKEEEKLRKTEEVQKKGAEEKVQKKAEAEKIQKADTNAIQPQVQLAVATTTAKVQSKEEEKLRKAAEEKVQKATEEKVQKVANVQQAGDEKVMKMSEGGESDQLSPEFEAKLQGTLAGGTPMERPLRSYMESRFDADFSQVRFHLDSTAIQMCNEIGARAFAYKNHVYFNRGQYQPDTDSGRFLIAHELTHVIQQGYAMQKGGNENAPAQLAPKSEEKLQSAPQNISSSAPRIQRLGWDTVNNAVRRVVPIWTLLTVIMGYNPILGESVARSPINWFQAMLDLIPVVGPSIFDKLRESGMIARAEAWFNSVFAELPSMGEIRATWDRCWSEMGITEGIDGNIAIFRRHFSPIFGRITTFVNRVLNKIVEFLRETLLRPLDNVIKDIPGWELICTLIGTNPLTGEAKPRTALNVLRGVVAFIPGGQEKLDQLVQSNALEKAYQWFITETTARNLTWPRIQATFTQAWDSLSANDILHPIDTFRRLAGIFSPLLVDLAGFAGAALMKLLEFIFEAVMGAGGARVLSILKKVQSTFLLIIRDPVGFLRNLINGVGQGVRQFMGNIIPHLRNGLIGWLTGGLSRAGLQLPQQWDMKGILSLLLQILGLTWDRVRAKMVTLMGERVVGFLERGFQFLLDVREKGLAEAVKERISEFFGNIREIVLGRIREFIQQRIVVAAITQILSLLSPVGAVIQAILKTYNTIMFFVEKINQIMQLVEAITDSIANIASGNIAAAANYVEATMARFIPVMLSFLSRFIGLGDIAAPIQRTIQSIQARVDAAMDRIVEWIRNTARSLLEGGRGLAQRGMEGIRGIIDRVKNRLLARIRGRGMSGPAFISMLNQIKTEENFTNIRYVPKPGVPNTYIIQAEVNPIVPLGEVKVRTMPSQTSAEVRTGEGGITTPPAANAPAGTPSPAANPARTGRNQYNWQLHFTPLSLPRTVNDYLRSSDSALKRGNPLGERAVGRIRDYSEHPRKKYTPSDLIRTANRELAVQNFMTNPTTTLAEVQSQFEPPNRKGAILINNRFYTELRVAARRNISSDEDNTRYEAGHMIANILGGPDERQNMSIQRNTANDAYNSSLENWLHREMQVARNNPAVTTLLIMNVDVTYGNQTVTPFIWQNILLRDEQLPDKNDRVGLLNSLGNRGSDSFTIVTPTKYTVQVWLRSNRNTLATNFTAPSVSGPIPAPTPTPGVTITNLTDASTIVTPEEESAARSNDQILGGPQAARNFGAPPQPADPNTPAPEEVTTKFEVPN